MFAKRFEKLLISEIEKFTETYNEENNDAIPQDYLEKLAEHFNESSKKQTKRVMKEIPAEERCIALKKEKTQCNARKAKDSNICNLHSRLGVKYGTIEDETVSNKTEPVQPIQKKTPKKVKQTLGEIQTCVYLIKKGNKKGNMCGKDVYDSVFCKTHSKSKPKSEETVEEVEDDEYVEQINMEKYENEELFGKHSDNENEDVNSDDD